MRTQTLSLNGPAHPMAGKIKLTGYSALAHRLGVPRTTAIRMVETGKVRCFSENATELVVDEQQVADIALETAIQTEDKWNRAQDRLKVATTLANPDAATDNDLIYSYCRTSGQEQAELSWHISKRKEAGRPFITQKLETELKSIEAAKAQFPRKVFRFNAKEGRTEEHLVAPYIQGKAEE